MVGKKLAAECISLAGSWPDFRWKTHRTGDTLGPNTSYLGNNLSTLAAIVLHIVPIFTGALPSLNCSAFNSRKHWASSPSPTHVIEALLMEGVVP
jgi:hypothetical protein